MNLMYLTRKIINKITIRKNKLFNKSVFKEKVAKDIPSNLIDLLHFSFNKKLSRADKTLGKKVELLRNEVARNYKEKNVATFASPRSGSKLFADDGSVIPGKFVESVKGGFARTGTGIENGIQLKKIIESIKASSILELGTNTGLSGCYFLSSKNNPYLHTIEGSSELCDIARSNLSEISQNFFVDNSMFDESIDSLIGEGKKFDLAFVDGQHEEKATLHYAQKLKKVVKKGGGILFDDIYWSEGMNNAWLKILKDDDFSLTLDLGTRGLCILKDNINIDNKLHFSVTEYTGKPLFNREGW